MNNKNEKLYLLIFGICLVISIVIEFYLFFDMNKLMASINDYENENVEYKTYEQYQPVFFNPVDYKWCDYYSKEDNCLLWHVLKEEDNNRLSLIYGEIEDNWSNVNANKIQTINDITSTWSDRLQIKNDSSLIFKDKKARLLLNDDVSTYEFQALLRSNILFSYTMREKDVNVAYIDKTQIPMVVNYINKSDRQKAGEIDENISNLYVLPVIEVEKEPINNEDYLSNAVYLDPTNLNKLCTKEEALNNVNKYNTPTNIKTGCMRWFKYKENNGIYTMILDHNTTSTTTHPSYVVLSNGQNVSPGTQALESLRSDYNWKVTPRLISLEEIIGITKNTWFDPTLANYMAAYRIETNILYSGSLSSEYRYTNKYNYLLSNLYQSSDDVKGNAIVDNNKYKAFSQDVAMYGFSASCPDGFCENEYEGSLINGYWMSNMETGTSSNTRYWYVRNYRGTIYTQENNQDWEIGIRPVIEVDLKNTVTYNDEERITTKEVQRGEKVESISSKGKEGYTFKYWSEDKINEFDFNTPIQKDTTLYAVYEINKYDVRFIDNEEEVKTLKVEYKNKIDQNEIPKIENENIIFKYWSEDKKEEFDFESEITEDKTLYAIYDIKDECNLSISSLMYDIDQANYTINNVPQDASNEDIMNNLTINANEKRIENDIVTIKCNRQIKEYKINRTWIPKTGQVLIKVFPLIGYISIITVLLITINKQREKNKRLRK